MYYNTTHVDTSQPLKDTSGNGRLQPWAQHRRDADLLAYAYDEINESKAARLRSCAPRLLYTMGEQDKLKLHTAWFCRVRLCPVCQWRRSLKIYGQAAQIIDAATTATSSGYGWIMLTLTVRNANADNLPKTIDAMSAAWHRLLKLDAWKRVVLGTMRSTEITHNADTTSKDFDTYHPHFHVLVCVNKSYFKSRDYLSYSAWQDLWKRAARLDYTPQVWVQRCKGTAAKALAEVAKYASKPSEYIDPSDLDMMQATVSALDNALHRRRLVAWTGLLKQLHKQLGLDDTDDGDLLHTDIEPSADSTTEATLAFSWVQSHKQYYKECE